MVGVDHTQQQPEHSHSLELGTCLLLYTDGLALFTILDSSWFSKMDSTVGSGCSITGQA